MRLGWWSTRIQAGLHVSDRTQEHSTGPSYFAYGALTLYGRPFQGRSSIRRSIGYRGPTTPAPPYCRGEIPRTESPIAKEISITNNQFSIGTYGLELPWCLTIDGWNFVTNAVRDGFGLFPVRSPLLRESLMISFPLVREMFQFPE